MDIYCSYKDGNGWRVGARNTGGSGGSLQARAVCYSGAGDMTVTTASNTVSLEGRDAATEVACEPGALVIGGGFVAWDDLPVTSHRPVAEGRWRVHTVNTSGAGRSLVVYGACLSTP
jgi:hypothetical protein